jgi:hypothetical protein
MEDQNMINVFLQKLPSITFEVFAVGVIVGLVMLVIFRPKKRRTFFWLLLPSVLFMIIWRIICHEVMLSARYFSILIYPAVIFTVWASFKMEPLSRWILRKTHTPLNRRWRFFCKFIPYFFVIGIGIACFGKSLRINPYWKAVPEICQTFKQIREPDVHVITNFRERLIAYYGDYDCRKIIKIEKSEKLSEKEQFFQTLDSRKNFPGVYYIFWEVLRRSKFPTAENMKLTPEIGKLELMERRFIRRQEKEELALFRFTPECPNITEWKQSVPPLSEKNLFKNGGFELAKKDKELENWIKHLQKSKLDVYLKSNWLYPSAWWLDVGWWNNVNPAHMYLSAQNPIAGKYSLRLDGCPPKKNAVSTSPYLPKGDYTYSFFIRGEGDKKSRIYLYFRGWLPTEKKHHIFKKLILDIAPGKLYKIHGKITADMLPAEMKTFIFLPIVVGDVTIDQMQIIPEKYK